MIHELERGVHDGMRSVTDLYWMQTLSDGLYLVTFQNKKKSDLVKLHYGPHTGTSLFRTSPGNCQSWCDYSMARFHCTHSLP